ncbi:unnamed protein product [Heligmosomoides polygyrus]|uniref:Reverse transcriptase domain-containing protein n=1 Tax=Heligmosomoides polygyrus TaxID=6339 RepID=A0A183FW29_HELPZ|nr:unnamed protein product [Heligmosomoides polygyrus]
MLNQAAAMPFNADLLNAIMEFQAHVESTFNHMAARLHSLEGDMSVLLEGSKPNPACVFCPVEDNRDGHTTSRCNRFPDVVAKSIQVARMGLGGICLMTTASYSVPLMEAYTTKGKPSPNTVITQTLWRVDRKPTAGHYLDRKRSTRRSERYCPETSAVCPEISAVPPAFDNLNACGPQPLMVCGS